MRIGTSSALVPGIINFSRSVLTFNQLFSDIQNEVVELLSNIVSDHVATECKKAGIFTLFMDGSSDWNNR